MRFGARFALYGALVLGAPILSCSGAAQPAQSAEPTQTPCDGSFVRAAVFDCPKNNALVIALFAAASAHDAAAVLAYGPRIEGPTADPDPAGYARITYEFALVVADPKRFSTRYVRALMKANFSDFHLLQMYGDAGFVSEDASTAPVEAAARAGDPYADAVILGSKIHPVNEFDPGFNDDPIFTNPRRLMAALRVMPQASIDEYFCTKEDTDRNPGEAEKAAAAMHPRDAAERAIVNGIRAAARNCSPYDANF